MNAVGSCKLCLVENVKLCNSHIFPEFLYREMYDPRLQSFNVYSSKSNWCPSRRYQGIYERLLCVACERRFRDLETYACQAFFNGLMTPPLQSKEGFIVQGIEYKRFKLFLISLIWRAGVSERSEFSNVKLHKHAERMRRMLYNENAGEVYDYPCMLFVMRGAMKSVMSMPESFRPLLGFDGYRATMYGLTWAFFVADKMKRFQHRDFFLNKKGELPLVLAKDVEWSS